MYTLDLGPIEQTVAKSALRSGAPIPDRIANAPVLHEGLELFIQAFFELDSERTVGFGPSPIPWSSQKLYAEHYGFDECQTEDLFFFVGRLDAVHLKRLSKKSETKPKGK